MTRQARTVPTPEALQAALVEHGSVVAACRALDVWRGAIYQQPELRAVIDAWKPPLPPAPPAAAIDAVVAPAAEHEAKIVLLRGAVEAIENALVATADPDREKRLHRDLRVARYRLALHELDNATAAARAIGITKQRAHQIPELRAVTQGWTPTRAEKRGQCILAIDPATIDRLDAAAKDRGTSRSAIARRLLTAALRAPLPPPLPADAWGKVKLDLGKTHDAIAARLGTTDAHAIAGVVRAILAG